MVQLPGLGSLTWRFRAIPWVDPNTAKAIFYRGEREINKLKKKKKNRPEKNTQTNPLIHMVKVKQNRKKTH